VSVKQTDYTIDKGINTGLFRIPSREDVDLTSNESRGVTSGGDKNFTGKFISLFKQVESKSS
jgi:hypothetical protein